MSDFHAEMEDGGIACMNQNLKSKLHLGGEGEETQKLIRKKDLSDVVPWYPGSP